MSSSGSVDQVGLCRLDKLPLYLQAAKTGRQEHVDATHRMLGHSWNRSRSRSRSRNHADRRVQSYYNGLLQHVLGQRVVQGRRWRTTLRR